MRPLEEVGAELTAPGMPFETVRETVNGAEVEVFKNRPPHLRAILEESLEYGDDELFLFEDGPSFSFRQHERAVASVAAALRDRHGIGPGDRVALLAENRAEWVLGAWATIALGGIAVGMNGWWKGDEIRYGIELTEPKLMIADARRLARFEGELPDLPIIDMDADFQPLLEHDPDAPLPDVPIDEDDPAVILFTSGTTGRPKGAISSHRNLIAFLDVMDFSLTRTLVSFGLPADGPKPRTVAIASAPLFHVSGFQSCMLAGPYAGSKLIWTRGRFDPEKIFRLTEEHGVTRWGGVTAQIFLMLDHPKLGEYDHSSVRSIGGGGSVWTPEIQRLVREKLPHASPAMTAGYGLTECGGLATIATDAMMQEHPDTLGSAMPTAEVAILDDDDKILPDGEEGNICVRGAMVMPGYWRNPEATADTIRPGGWLKTGDIGHLRDGLLFMASRKRDMILRGSENVYPIEIENRLEAHPDVIEAAVIGVAHRSLGQEVKAIVVPRPDTTPSAEGLRSWVAETLADYKVPAHVEVRSEPLPRNATGKVLKNVLSGERENPFVAD